MSTINPTRYGLPPVAQEPGGPSTSRPSASQSSSATPRPTNVPPRGKAPTAQEIVDDMQTEWLQRQAQARQAEIDRMRGAKKGKAPLTAADERQAGYLAARKAEGRPAEGPLLDMLVRGNETVKEVNAFMHLGRGNVRSDLKANKHASYRVTDATREMLEVYDREGHELNEAGRAGVVAHAGAGCCQEFAMVTQSVHAARLKPGESVAQVEHSKRDHAWDVFEGAAGEKVVIDTWGEGPAVEAGDAMYMKRPTKVDELTKVTHQTAPATVRDFQEALEGPAKAIQGRIDYRRKQLDKKGAKPLFALFPIPIIRKSVAQSARKAMETLTNERGEQLSVPKGIQKLWLKAKALVSDSAKAELRQAKETKQKLALRNELLAAGAALEVGASVRQATDSAVRIIDDAKHLRRPIPLSARAPAAQGDQADTPSQESTDGSEPTRL